MNGDRDEEDLRQGRREDRGFDEITEADVVRRQRARKIGRETRLEEPDGTDRLVIHCCIDDDQRIVVVEKGKKMKPAGAAVDQPDVLRIVILRKFIDCMNADAFIAHQVIADTKDQRGFYCLHWCSV